MSSAAKKPSSSLPARHGRTPWQNLKDALGTHLTGVEWNMNTTLALLWRRWQLIALVVTLALASAGGFLLLTPPQYTAQTMLQINTRQEQVLKIEDVVSGLTAGDAAIRTEVDILKSRKLAQRVIEKLKLMENPAFMSQDGPLNVAKRMVNYFLFPDQIGNPLAPPRQPSQSAQVTRAIDKFLSKLRVNQVPRSYSIVITFTSSDAILAAQIANAVADAYLTSQLEDKFDATKRANDWLNNRLKQLQRNVQQAELAVRKFRDDNGLTQAQGVTLNEQQLSELNSQLILARTKQAEAEVERQIAPRNAANRARLDGETARAKARVETLEAQLSLLQTKTELSGAAEVQLGELERQAQAERSLYQAFLGRSREIAQMDFVQSDARVIYAAERPLRPSSPKKGLVLMVAGVAGVLLGMGFAFLLEALDSGFRTTQQLEALARRPVLGLLPEIKKIKGALAQTVLKQPTGVYTEAVRTLRTALPFLTPEGMAQVVLMTSSVPEEGKSLAGLSLAQLTAASGQKVLLVEADLRRPTLRKALELGGNEAGLADVLAGTAKMKDVLHTVEGSTLKVIAAGKKQPFAQELLGRSTLKTLIEQARKDYDLVIIDAPPVMAVADALQLAPLADAVLFLVRWGTTPRAMAMTALKQLLAPSLPPVGLALSRVDLERQASYGLGDYGHYYGKYQGYYTD